MQLAAREITRLEHARIVLARNAFLGLLVAGCVFALSYANGGFDTTTKAYAGITAWWLLGTAAAIGVAQARARVDRLALVALGLLAAFALWTLLSMSWASDGGRAFAQFDQVSLYVAVLAIAIALGRLVPSSVIVGGVALALSAIACVALASRFFPSTFGVEPSTILPSITSRLSFPLGYWNGLGIEVALAYPLLLSIMVSRRSRVARRARRAAAATPRRGDVPDFVARCVSRGRRRRRRVPPPRTGSVARPRCDGRRGRRGRRLRGDACPQDPAPLRRDDRAGRRTSGA